MPWLSTVQNCLTLAFWTVLWLMKRHLGMWNLFVFYQLLGHQI
ncbi:hypothetical protein LINPERPRIM_LOCUS20492 [Linum perenne]